MEGQLRNYGMEPNPRPEVLWNFEKILVDRDGHDPTRVLFATFTTEVRDRLRAELGLVAVDRQTFKRTPKPSAVAYRQLVRRERA